MATFQIPQFIEERSKIVGFLTLPQFLYVAVAAIGSFISFYVFTFFLWLLVSLVLGGGAIALAFVKVNGQELPAILASGFSFLWKPHRYTWQRAMAQTTLDIADVEKIETLRKSMSFQDKLKSLATSVMTGKILSSHESGAGGEEKFEVVSFLTGEKKMAHRVDYSEKKK
ncbi:MAG: hypothetical protein WCW78_01340 [Candidatus Paceibacterota bacterium]|jgi:hypothetical protein